MQQNPSQISSHSETQLKNNFTARDVVANVAILQNETVVLEYRKENSKVKKTTHHS